MAAIWVQWHFCFAGEHISLPIVQFQSRFSAFPPVYVLITLFQRFCKMTTEGFECFDEPGVKVKYLLNMWGNFGDPTAGIQRIGVLKRMEGSQFSHWSLKVKKFRGKIKLLIQTKFYSGNCSFSRKPLKILGTSKMLQGNKADADVLVVDSLMMKIWKIQTHPFLKSLLEPVQKVTRSPIASMHVSL